MKKTLLCFLFLLPTLIFAQISSIIHCAGDNVFDLTSKTAELTKDRDPSQTYTIRYFLKYSDPAKGHEILNPQNYVCTDTHQEIFANVEGEGGTRTSYSFMIIVNSRLEFANASVSYPECGNTRVYLAARYGRSPHQYSLDGVHYQTASSFNNVAPGSYNIHIKDDYGCTKDSTLVVPSLTPFTATFLKIDNTCFGFKDGRIEVTANGGKLPYRYSINNNSAQTSNIFPNLAAGTYTVKVTDSNNCLEIYTLQIEQPNILLTPTTARNVTTPGGNDGEITVMASGGTPYYSYLLRNDFGIVRPFQSSNRFTAVAAGNYYVEVRDSKGCLTINPITVSSDPISSSPLVVSAAVTGINCTNFSGTITAQAAGGSGSYLYSLDGYNYVASNIFPNLSPGIYNLKVKDSNNVTESMNVIIEPYAELTVTGESSKIVSCSENSSSTITLTASGGARPYRYAIDNSAIYQESNTFSDLSAGTHTFTVKDANECTASNSLLIESPTSLTASAVVTQAQFCGDQNSVTINASGGKAPYAYSFSMGGIYSGINTSTLSPGNYTLFVKDSNGCIATTNVTVLAANVPVTTILSYTDVTSANSNDGSITVNATGGILPYRFSFLNSGSPAIISPASNFTFNNLAPGNYEIIVTDAKNCISQSLQVTITAPNPSASLTATADLVQPNCSNPIGVITVNASGGSGNYQYSIDGTTFNYSNVFTVSQSGTYTVNVRDSDNGLFSFNVAVSPLNPMALTATIISPVTCNNNGTIMAHVINGQAPYSYSINGSPFQYDTSIFTNLIAGNYSITAKDANGCMENAMITLQSPVALSASMFITEPQTCGDKHSVTIDATGGQVPYSYSFSGGDNYSQFNTSKLDPGTYSFFVKDANGCVAMTNTVTILSTTPLTTIATATNTTSANSSDGSITAMANGGIEPYTYSLLNNDNSVFVPAQANNTFNNLLSGMYGVIVKDALGCTSGITKVTISASLPTLIATIDILQPNCAFETGTITINATGGSGTYLYSIDNGITYSNSNIFNAVQPGTYTINVRDYNNTTYTSNVIIVAPVNPVLFTVSIVSPISCFSNGTIEVNAIEGKAPYSYSLNGSLFQTNKTFTNLVSGSYVISVKDANGCTNTSTITLQGPNLISASASVKNQTVTIDAQGGTGKLMYAISPNLNQYSANNIFSNLTFGTYTVIIQDESGCFVQLMVTVDPSPPVINGKTEIVLEFKSGQTLADIVIEGENIKWYSSKGTSTSKTNKSTETSLPLSTVLVDGVTYYASQTINGIESTERLAVTAKFNSSLATPDFDFNGFKFYPNPVKHMLSIANKTVIDNIEIFSVSGQSVLFKKINSTESEIDLSNLSVGMYIINVKSDGKEKAMKFIKK
ncbi:T9SS type A sorting domain-containing protein [Flavobacterium sp. 17A]|uniref:T9SS type A sorting domain-containing protein n=1 Tax=Flavobacterium potami TaxID=2872310 RepID=A0A9X1HC17_9FLAO|nr:T9SS type A sorting domain-containing protein [Flavobacterium potami]MBZ4036016.1 T9SS type A sorting domain-containing protein [Flavobacterium potami]